MTEETKKEEEEEKEAGKEEKNTGRKKADGKKSREIRQRPGRPGKSRVLTQALSPALLSLPAEYRRYR